jgi:hypothetical protein
MKTPVGDVGKNRYYGEKKQIYRWEGQSGYSSINEISDYGKESSRIKLLGFFRIASSDITDEQCNSP